MTPVVVVTDWGVTAHNLLAINLGSNRNMLTNGEAKNILAVRETEPIAGQGLYGTDGTEKPKTDMAVLGETLIFCTRGNSCQTLGFKLLVRPAKE